MAERAGAVKSMLTSPAVSVFDPILEMPDATAAVSTAQFAGNVLAHG
jgi:hypothetical protein